MRRAAEDASSTHDHRGLAEWPARSRLVMGTSASCYSSISLCRSHGFCDLDYSNSGIHQRSQQRASPTMQWQRIVDMFDVLAIAKQRRHAPAIPPWQGRTTIQQRRAARWLPSDGSGLPAPRRPLLDGYPGETRRSRRVMPYFAVCAPWITASNSCKRRIWRWLGAACQRLRIISAIAWFALIPLATRTAAVKSTLRPTPCSQ